MGEGGRGGRFAEFQQKVKMAGLYMKLKTCVQKITKNHSKLLF